MLEIAESYESLAKGGGTGGPVRKPGTAIRRHAGKRTDMPRLLKLLREDWWQRDRSLH
jgi:hypothetical protein